MSVNDDPKSLGRARLSFSSQADIDEFVTTLERFEKGELSSNEWRAFRLLRGTYGQRQEGDFHMLRAKIPQGVLDGPQLRALAEVSERYSRGFGHITTRQNLQFHFVKLADADDAMKVLADAGITTREACGNSVRNITACHYAGTSPDEAFDVTPYAEALTRYLLRHPLSSSLPRKFKVAFEGCTVDHVYSAINDLGFRALIRQVQGKQTRGFRVTVAGGTAVLTNNGQLLHDFVPASELFGVAEAVVRVFHRFGDREHRHRNRLKFLLRQMGWDRFHAEYLKARAEALEESPSPLPFDPDAPPVEVAPRWTRPAAPSAEVVAARAASSVLKGPGLLPEVLPKLEGMAGFEAWKKTNVRAQKQVGYVTAQVTVPLGDLTGEQLRLLAELAVSLGDGQVRVTADQNVLMRWVAEEDLSMLYLLLRAAGLGLRGAETLEDVTSCPGAESCKLAVTQSRGLGALLGDFLRARPDLVELAPELKIKISGCPNGCGQHHIAGIGFQGSIRKVGEKVAPQYFVMLGGGLFEDGASFGRIAAKVPARRIPQVVERLLKLYQAERAPAEAPADFFRRLELPKAKTLLQDLERITTETAQPNDFMDLGEHADYKPETSDGECAA